MVNNFAEYGYIGVFLALVAAGFGFPIPEELPILTAGVLVGHEDTSLRWWVMLPVCILGVVISDGILYAIGRIWGDRLLDVGWVKRHLVPPDKRGEIEKNFHDRGIMVLLGARLLPGIRTPIFIMAGVLRVPKGRFLLADGLYAIPGVTLLFFLAYMLTDQVLEIFKKIDQYRPLVVVAVLSGVVGAVLYKFVFTRKVATGNPQGVPKIITKPAEALTHVLEQAVDRVTHRSDHGSVVLPPGSLPVPPASANGTPEPKPDAVAKPVVPPG
jgi:membrane protein DedA with SNARE-associated domain